LKAWGSGDEAALARVTEHVYAELRLMARRYMKNDGQSNTLRVTFLRKGAYPYSSTQPGDSANGLAGVFTIAMLS